MDKLGIQEGCPTSGACCMGVGRMEVQTCPGAEPAWTSTGQRSAARRGSQLGHRAGGFEGDHSACTTTHVSDFQGEHFQVQRLLRFNNFMAEQVSDALDLGSKSKGAFFTAS